MGRDSWKNMKIDPRDPNWRDVIGKNNLGDFIDGKFIPATEFTKQTTEIKCPKCNTVLIKADFKQEGKIMEMTIMCMVCYRRTGEHIVARILMRPNSDFKHPSNPSPDLSDLK